MTSEYEESLELFKKRLKTMTPEEKKVLVNDLCSRVNEASFDLIAAHKMKKSPTECLDQAYQTLFKGNQNEHSCH